MQIELNIGLNVKGIYNEANKESFLNLISNELQSKNSYRFDVSEYEGQTENTLIAIICLPLYKLNDYVSKLTIKTNQVCIAVRYINDSGNTYGRIIYNPFCKNGKKLKFDKNYFIPFTDCNSLVHSIGYSMHM